MQAKIGELCLQTCIMVSFLYAILCVSYMHMHNLKSEGRIRAFYLSKDDSTVADVFFLC